MKIDLYIIQKKTPPLYQQAMNEYLKRLQTYATLSVTNIKNESKLKDLKENYDLVLMVKPSKDTMDSVEFSQWMEQVGMSGNSKLAFLIGATDENISQVLSVSSFSFQPYSTAVILLEQIYRGYRIIHHHAYHK